ncbi:putative disease resistance protein RGA3 [Cinnamomum micranthum f. kanehirae]|uniref:Putative disease resistance protein RGA3 n=1 Tax=Cinnamomum micranthum f. kanehirae TaxID=337451 RepID=A0A3S4NB75_9MAGN|nr:putative disease resistance protein RGA3 [Cinnamomum micranthum f. kanehirae]
MADALVSVVVEGLCAIAKDEVSLLVGVKQEVKKLSSAFMAIQAGLEDAENQQVTKKAVRDWLGKLKDVAYEMEDILEEWRIEALRSHGDNDDIHKRKKVLSCLQFSCLGFKQVELRHDIGHKIREITKRLSEISIEKSSFNFNEASTSERPKMNERETSPLIDESEIFGRDAVKKEIVNGLVSETSKDKRPFSVVSIVGMGGLGKTTLAQLVFNDETIMKHFEKRVWVCVSEDYDVYKILTKVIQTLGGSTDGNLDFGILQQSLHAIVGKKRFLLVLDDVWDERLWGKLRVPLKGAAPGSRIVVTTRSRTVADVMETTHNHELGILSDSDCWKLFTSRAFRERNEEEWPPGLTAVGKQIVHRCKGVPLAIRTVGSLLYFKRTKEEWQMVSESETWKWKSLEEGVDILPALLLSYYNLPIHLKQCLSFCSLFPKDYELKKDELVKLWMARGIIYSEKAKKDVTEKIGEMYFDDLLTRSLFQDAEKDIDGNVVRCKMHDLVHDLATFVSSGDYCSMEARDSELCSIKCHHLSLLVNRNVSSIPSPLCSAEHLRTLLLFGSSTIKEVPHSLFNHLKFLRALDLRRTMIENLPSSLGKLKHLRYLDLSWLDITELPESVSDLCNLQTLKLNCCRFLSLLPSGMSKMVKLRHLEIEYTDDLTFLPSGIGRLSSLRTLSKFPVGDEKNRGCKIGELKNLNLLSGILQIQNLEKVIINPVEAREAELDKKCHLRVLTLECNDKTEEEWGMLGEGEMEKMERVFEGLRPPHSNLEVLSIENYEGSKFPSWLEDAKFSSLCTVYLENCRKCRLLPGRLGKLPSLEALILSGAEEIKVVGGQFYGNGNEGGGKGRAFPKLKKLDFSGMSNWEEWKLTKEDGEVMPSLDKLSIYDCNKLKALPNCLPNTLRRVEIKNCSEVIWAPDNPLPLLEELHLRGDVRGILSNPLPCLPALKKLFISSTSIESLPSDGWGLLESLNTLQICFCDKLASLPNGLGQLKSLQTIAVDHCSELRSLFDGFERLKSLHRLHISRCPELRPLPNLQHLTALEEIKIAECPLVTERLEKEKGEDWCNISHIPYIEIDRYSELLMVKDEQKKWEDSVDLCRGGQGAPWEWLDIHPELVNPDAIELVSYIRREYTTKLDQSQEWARKLHADLDVEEQCGQELGGSTLIWLSRCCSSDSQSEFFLQKFSVSTTYCSGYHLNHNKDSKFLRIKLTAQ